MAEYIEFKNVVKRFPGSVAVKGVSFSVRKGEVHALMGENGAGKSTLLNIFHGVFPASEGDIFIDGQRVNFPSAHAAIAYGIAKVHQEINAVPELSVTENIMLGMESTRNGFLCKADMHRQTQELLDKLGCTFSAEARMKDLSPGQKQMVAIAKALHIKAKIISFDEPTASLSDSEVTRLFTVIDDLKRQGITIFYISHKLDEIFRICDRVTVLRDGEYISTLDLKNTDGDTLIRAMVGRDVAMFAQRTLPSVVRDETILSVRGLHGEVFQDVSFDLKRGEILGFFGLVGAGRTEIMRALFGADPSLVEQATLCDRPLDSSSPTAAIECGLGLISENRKEEGFVKNLCNMDNVALPCLRRFVKGIFIDEQAKFDNLLHKGEQVGLRPNEPEFMTASLSGGNTQKVILAKWLSTDCEVLVFDEPTKGIDIGAKADIYKLMEQFVATGKAIIMVSSELTEIIGMSDRILVMREGLIVRELNRNEFDEETILAYAVGGRAHEETL